MTTLGSRNADLLAAWMISAAAMSFCVRAIRMSEVIKEIAVFVAIVGVLIFLVGRKFRGETSKDYTKASKEQSKPVISQTASNGRSGATVIRTVAPQVREKQTVAVPLPTPTLVAPRAPPPLPSAPQENRQLSKKPVLPPTFASKDFDDQADELSQHLLPTEGCLKVVKDIAQDIRKIIVRDLPYADVTGFTNGEVSRGTAYGVAVPEVDIVVNLAPHILVRTMQNVHPSKIHFSGKVDDRRLHKSGLRMCTDLLVTSGGFKFRRSAFRGRDPKVTLMAPRSFDNHSCIPIDFSVNAATPLCNWVIINACAKVDPRAQVLILLVKRWAKDRGICHAAKGHLMPYAWTLLCVYFLQVGVKGGSLLPPFKHLRLTNGQDSTDVAGLDQCMQGWESPVPGSVVAAKRVGQLFKEFINFYLTEVDWSSEMASIRWGTRCAPHRSLRLNVLETSSGKEVTPTIEDPFLPSENMSELLSVHGLNRLKEEFRRAHTLFENEAELSEILTQWVPTDQKGDVGDGSVSGDDAEFRKESITVEAESGKGSLGTAASTPTDTITEVSAPAVEVSAPAPVPPWRKNKDASATSKKQMQPPPGLWCTEGKPPMPWPTKLAPSSTTSD